MRRFVLIKTNKDNLKTSGLLITFPFPTPSGWEFKRCPPKRPELGKWNLAKWNRQFDSYLSGYALVKKYQAHERRKVLVLRQVEKKQKFIRDDLNLREGCKPLFDALVRAKLLIDDDIKWLDDRYEQCVGEPSTLVKITWGR